MLSKHLSMHSIATIIAFAKYFSHSISIQHFVFLLKSREISFLIWGVFQEVGWTVTNALTGASLNRSRWLCGSNVLSLVPQLLNLHPESDLIDRTLYAIELLITKRNSCIFVLENYQIIQTIHQIVQSQNNQFDAVIKVCTI